ncbi:hypothetical protein [Streptomyces phytohabitans]|uniref:hypothetical protein n=1 Tax=Streptomyces phytohabitans TaxID=1150371 RepID=UPI00345C1E81
MTPDSKPDYEPKTRDAQEVHHEVSTLSSNVLDMIAIQGKVTEPGPMKYPCGPDEGDSDGLNRVRHPWSLYGVSNAKLQTGMENLERELPSHGWKIAKVGEDGSRNRNREILAVHDSTRSQLEVAWLKGEDGHQALLEVTVYSRCFVAR